MIAINDSLVGVFTSYYVAMDTQGIYIMQDNISMNSING